MAGNKHTTVRIDAESNDIIEAVQDQEADEFGTPSKKAIVKHALLTVYGGGTTENTEADH